TCPAPEFCGADSIVVPGGSTGRPPDVDHVRGVRAAVTNRVVVGSGITPENVHSYASNCDALMFGPPLKHGGVWKNRVDPERVRKLVQALDRVQYVKT